LFEKIPKFAWIILILGMFIGLLTHQNMWAQYWAVWFTSAMMFLSVAIYFFYPGTYTGAGVLVTNIMWLTNQLIEWLGYGTPTLFAVTFIVNTIVVFIMLFTLKRNGDEFSGKLYASAGFMTLMIFSFLKIYSLAIHSTNFVPGAVTSGNIWALGLLLMASGGLLKIFVTEDNGKFSGTVTLVGLIIALSGALVFGTALSIFQPLVF